jgi:hypothetical protein
MVPESRERDPRELCKRLARVRRARGDYGRIAYEAPIAEELEDPRAPHRVRPWAEHMREVEQRRDRRNWMAQRRRWRRNMAEARRLVLPGLKAEPAPDVFPFLPLIEYRGKDSALFRMLHRDPIPWEMGPYQNDSSLFDWIEIPEGAEGLDWPEEV